MTDVRFIYMTASTSEEAERIAELVVRERLAACANVLGQIRSFYHWDGKFEQGVEVALVLKTVESLEAPLVARIRGIHSYDCPAIVVLPVLGGNEAFLEWIRAETLPLKPPRVIE